MMQTIVCNKTYADIILRAHCKIHSANGGLTFLLLPFEYLVGWGIINLVFSMNSFRYQQLENYLPAVVPTARRQVSAASRFIGSRSVRRH
jgi:hypothetical protein